MNSYPIFLDLTYKDVLVVGAGEVGQRKITSLLGALPKTLTVVDPAPVSKKLKLLLDKALALETQTAITFLPLHQKNGVNQKGTEEGQAPFSFIFLNRSFLPEDVEGKSLVFAATHNTEVNALIAAFCRHRGIWCNVADAPGKSDFIVPSLLRQGEVTLAISTGANSPALARKIRTELELWLGNKYTALAMVLGRLRPLLLGLGLPSSENTAIFRALVDSSLAEFLMTQNYVAARALLEVHLPTPLHRFTGDLLHDL